MKKLKIACVGAGRLAQSSHLPSLTALDAVELAAISDLDPARLEEAAGRFGIKNRYLDYRGMLEKERPDAVFVIVPPHHVYDIMVFCLQRKLHVFLEKPPGLTSGQTRQLALLAEANHCLTMVGFQRRHIPLLKLVRGRLGDVDQIMVSYYKNTVGQPPYYNGAIDILRCDAIHAVDTLRWLGGEVAALASSVRSLHATYDNSFNALLRFQSGVVGRCRPTGPRDGVSSRSSCTPRGGRHSSTRTTAPGSTPTTRRSRRSSPPRRPPAATSSIATTASSTRTGISWTACCGARLPSPAWMTRPRPWSWWTNSIIPPAKYEKGDGIHALDNEMFAADGDWSRLARLPS